MLVTEFANPLSKERQTELLQDLRTVLELDQEIKEFIGAHPVPLSKDTIQYLLSEDYLVCEKSDGIRLMLFVSSNTLYFYDRKNVFYQTDLIITNTNKEFLFDGEMYFEAEGCVYAMFDTLICDGNPVLADSLSKRLGYCFEFERVVKSGAVKRKNSSILKSFVIVGKHMYKSYAFQDVLRTIPKLKHENDGLIFTPVNESYNLYTRSKIIKWKPPHLNTVDFLIKKSDEPGVFLLLCEAASHQISMVSRMNTHDAKIQFGHFFTSCQEDLDGKIGEFSYSFDKECVDPGDLCVVKGAWQLHRIRTDKNSPNNIKVVLDTFDSIHDTVSEEGLKKYQQHMRDNYKLRGVM